MAIHKKLYTSAFLSLSRKERLAMISKAHKECLHGDGFLNSLVLLLSLVQYIFYFSISFHLSGEQHPRSKHNHI